MKRQTRIDVMLRRRALTDRRIVAGSCSPSGYWEKPAAMHEEDHGIRDLWVNDAPLPSVKRCR